MANRIGNWDRVPIQFVPNADGLTYSPVFLAGGGTGNANVQRVNAGFMAQGQTAKQYVGKQATSTSATTTVNLETVTAGKTFYLTDILITSDQSTLLDVRIQAAGTDIFRCACRDIAPVDMTGIETQPFATSGQALTLVLPQTTSVQNVWYDLFGWEQ